MKRSSVLLIVLVAGCSGRVETDDRPAFIIDRTKPFLVEIGRGGYRTGLDTIKVDHTGRIVLHRAYHQKRQDDQYDLIFEIATLQLSPDALVEVVKAVEANNLMALGKAYYDARIADGTQWVLWIRQGEQEKVVYCDNRFPPAITEFAEQLDEIISRAGLDDSKWQPESRQGHLQNQRELTDCVTRLHLSESALGNLGAR